jgi:hypothetical protein
LQCGSPRYDLVEIIDARDGSTAITRRPGERIVSIASPGRSRARELPWRRVLRQIDAGGVETRFVARRFSRA